MERKIQDVEAEVSEAKVEAREAMDAGYNGTIGYWVPKEQVLRTEKQQLRTKEQLLREEKAGLRMEIMQQGTGFSSPPSRRLPCLLCWLTLSLCILAEGLQPLKNTTMFMPEAPRQPVQGAPAISDMV